MLNNKYIISVTNVELNGTTLDPFYLGEDSINHNRLSHDIFEFDTIESAKLQCDPDNYIDAFTNAVFTIHLVQLTDVEANKHHSHPKDN